MNFFQFCVDPEFLSSDLKSKAQNYVLHEILALSIKNKETRKNLHFFGCHNISK